MKCQYCGKEIKGKSHKKNTEKKYCNIECFKKARGCNTFHYTICNYCGKTFKESRDRPNLYCSQKCAGKGNAQERAIKMQAVNSRKKELLEEYTRLIREAEQIRFLLENEKPCKVCGKLFVNANHNVVCCSTECSRRNTNRNKDKRIYRNGQPDLSITLQKLYERDKGRCQICGASIDFNCDCNSDEYPSIDHIKPITKGGMHSWDNVQLTCRRCNYLKGASD